MIVEPVNRFLLINLPEEKPAETSGGILLPEEYQPVQEKYSVAQVVAWAEDVRFAEHLNTLTKVVVDRSMVEEITCDGHTYSLVQDNYIMGIILNKD